MKALILTSLLALLSIGSAKAQLVECEEFHLNGKVFNNVKIIKTSPAWVSIHHNAGIKSCVPIDSLPVELQEFFAFDKNTAVQWHGYYLRSCQNEAIATQKRIQERQYLERERERQDLEHRRKLETVRAKQQIRWKSDMRNSRPICKNPKPRTTVYSFNYIIR